MFLTKNTPPPTVSDLVLIGGGHAHVHVIKMLGMSPFRQILWQQGIRVTCITKDVHTPYSGMLPGFVAGHYTYDEIHLDLNQLCRFSNITLIHASCIEILPNKKINFVSGGGGFCKTNDGRPPLRYDCLSIDVGSAPSATSQSFMDHPHVIPVKPISNFASYYQSLMSRITKLVQDNKNQQTTTKHTIAIVGGGAGGLELALSVQYMLEEVIAATVATTTKSQLPTTTKMEEIEVGTSTEVPIQPLELKTLILTRGQSLLKAHNRMVQRKVRQVLEERNITVQLGAEVIAVKEHDGTGQALLILKNQNDAEAAIRVDDCLWCTSAGAPSWLSTHTPFPTDAGGFVEVDDTYQVIDYPGVFAAGDCCHNVNHPRPKGRVYVRNYRGI
jgi:selenide, water dikinase